MLNYKLRFSEFYYIQSFGELQQSVGFTTLTKPIESRALEQAGKCDEKCLLDLLNLKDIAEKALPLERCFSSDFIKDITTEAC
ncbi:hypothetical protein ACTXT7_008500 [Hymenolepis weldensis]